MFGPVHEYVAPVTVGVLSEIVEPSQYGPLFEAVGVDGIGLTTTAVVPAADVRSVERRVREEGRSRGVAEHSIDGFCRAEVKLFGPVHEYVAPVTVGVLSEIVEPSQYGPLFEAVGVDGIGLTTTAVVPAADVQPLTVTVTE